MDISTEHTGAMIALIPSEADLDRLTLDSGEPRGELHLTFYYLGDANVISPETRNGMITAVGGMMESRQQGPVHGRAFGVAHWNPDGDDPAWVLNVSELPDDERNGETMSYVRGSVTEALYDGQFDVDMPVQHNPWQPHICLAYSSDDRSADVRTRLGDVTFNRLRFAFGGEVTDIPLGSAATVTSTSGGTVTQAEGSVVTAATESTVGDIGPEVVVAAKAKPSNTDCPKGSRTLPDGSCMTEEEFALESQWEGVLVVEGITTGDGREFAPNALTWADHALLRWQKEGSHGGDHDVTVSVGRIDEVWRVGSQVVGRGVLNLESTDGFEIYKRMKNGFAGGISIDADDIMDADVEFVWPEPSGDAPEGGEDDADMLLSMLFGSPEKMIFHGGRVRAATLVDIPAFVEAYIGLSGSRQVEQLVAGATMTCDNRVVLPHTADTSDAPWDNHVNARQLPNVMPVELAREAYALVADQPTRVGKTDCNYLHHEVHDGKVVSANLTACSVGIAALDSDRSISPSERRAIYEHLATHLRDANQEPPPLTEPESIVAASVAKLDEWRPDATWFANPRLNVPVGITVTDQGRVYGHAAQWGECHIGYEDLCVTPPHEDVHPYFMTGEMVCADGSRVAVGQITLGTGHAPLNYRASRAVEHYDNTGSVVADVAVGNDEHGIWVAGAIRANAAASRVHELRASGQVSGDWRRIGNQLRLVGLLAVNVPGFPVPRLRARVASGAPTALIAAGQTSVGRGGLIVAAVDTESPLITGKSEEELNALAMRRVMSLMAQRVHGDRETEEV